MKAKELCNISLYYIYNDQIKGFYTCVFKSLRMLLGIHASVLESVMTTTAVLNCPIVALTEYLQSNAFSFCLRTDKAGVKSKTLPPPPATSRKSAMKVSTTTACEDRNDLPLSLHYKSSKVY